MKNRKIKSTAIRTLLDDQGSMIVLFSPNNRHDPRSQHRIDKATELFGPPGLTPDRRWHYRHTTNWTYRHEPIKDGAYYSLPYSETWFHMYFRDPKDAAWFQLNYPA